MREPLYRVTLDAATLLREHPPQFRHPHKKLLFDLAYPDSAVAAGRIEVSRWAQAVAEPLSFPAVPVDLVPNFYDYEPVADSTAAIEWHVNFADPRLFVAYGSGLFAQDEMQVAEHPLLASVRETLLARGLDAMTTSDSGGTPILVSNVERRLEVLTDANVSAGRPGGLYGNRFASALAEAIRQATRLIEPPTRSNFIAMAAPVGGRGEYSESEIEFIFATAHTAFAAARQESLRAAGESCQIVVHSGFWGCGAFGGNRRLMIALQTLAARSAGIDRLVFHTGDQAGLEEARRGVDVAEALAMRCGSPCSLAKLVGRVVLLGCRWGVSDGN